MTDYIAELSELNEKGTKGPWDFREKVPNLINIGNERYGLADVAMWRWGEPGPADENRSNAQLIVALRNSLPLWLKLAEAAERIQQKWHEDKAMHCLGDIADLFGALKELRGK
jgi:hypothetical protein